MATSTVTLECNSRGDVYIYADGYAYWMYDKTKGEIKQLFTYGNNGSITPVTANGSVATFDIPKELNDWLSQFVQKITDKQFLEIVQKITDKQFLEIVQKITNSLVLPAKSQSAGKSNSKSPKIHIGPKGGKYYISKGNKVYI